MSDDDRSPLARDLATRAAWQRWEMDSLETLKSRQSRRASDQDPKGKSELLRLRAAALAEAREQGLNKGFQAGHEQGRAQGHAQGLIQGRTEGYEQGHAQGLSAGHAQGHAAGYAEGAEAARTETARLNALADSVGQALDTIEQTVGQSLIALAVRIAEQVLRTSLDTQAEHLLDLVSEIINVSPLEDATLRLRLNPDDLLLVQQFLKQDPEAPRYRLIADERITRGGCIADTGLGSIDATIETRWKRVLATLGHTP
ncbi:flagellar assembly protein FliH [Alcaligenaceae bacterium CGII-47]|nr:flagellar assembly protein FliH [Alcaligenaceae bacterium CGII-47]